MQPHLQSLKNLKTNTMRKLKIQMNILLDNKWDNDMREFCIDNLQNVDCILHGRKTAEGFIPYWNEVADNACDSEYMLGKRFTEIAQVVFSNTIAKSNWDNTTIINGEVKDAISNLKNKNGNDILVYGGDSFVTSLLQHGQVDEIFLLINPATLGNGQETFNPLRINPEFNLTNSKRFKCGTMMLQYTK